MSENTPHDSFPLAGRSRSRRRLLLFYAQNEALGADVPIDSTIENGPEEFVVSVSRCDQGRRETRDPHGRSRIRAVRELLDGEDAVTWLLCGDTLIDCGDCVHGWRGFHEYFADRLRRQLGRTDDIVIDVTMAGESSGDLRRRLERILPDLDVDVVSVMVGLCDAQGGPQGLAIFLHNLRQIVEQIRGAGAVPLLHTPHRIDTARAAHHSDMRRYVKAIRETTRELHVACVDHWRHWQRMERTRGDVLNLLDELGIFPGPRGHREIARYAFARLGVASTRPSARQAQPK